MTDTKYVRGRLTFGRFVGDPLPGRDLPPWAVPLGWGRWLSDCLSCIPTRLCVLPGDLCQHDWHHRHPRGDWSNACYERQQDLTAGCPGWRSPIGRYGGSAMLLTWSSQDWRVCHRSLNAPCGLAP
jgi:hypothetical protein